MPRNSDSYFGKGFSGDAMRSMLIDRVAGEIAKSGRLGVLEAVGGLNGLADTPAAPETGDLLKREPQAPEVGGE